MQEQDVIVMAGLEQLIDFFERQARQFADAGAPVEIEGPCSFLDLYTYFRVMPAGEHDWCRAARVELIEQSDGCLRLWFQLDYFPDHDLFWRVVDGLVGGMKQHGFHILEPVKTRDTEGGIAAQEEAAALDRADKEQGPTTKTKQRAKVFRRLKDEHPEWTQYRVAMEASEELGEHVSGETVRNAYRAMGWKWERADRVR